MINEEMYKVAWRRKHDINERAFYAYLQTKLNIQTKEYIASLEGKDPRVFHITSYFSDAWMMEILKDAYTKFGLKQFAFLKTISTKDEESDEEDFNNAWLLLLLLLFNDITTFIVALGIIHTIKVDIARFVKEKLSQGVSTSAIITMLSVYLTQKNIIRSQTIARTEITKIMNLATYKWAEMQPTPKKKKWIVTLDGKERASHGAMASYPAINLSEKFLVGSSLMMHPGDNSAPAEELVNCRCALMFV